MSRATTRGATEAEVLRNVSAYFRAHGWTVWRLQSGTAHGGKMRMADKGAPDLIALSPAGRVALLEIKAPGGKLRPGQREMRDILRAAGHDYAVCRGVEDAAEVRTCPIHHGLIE